MGPHSSASDINPHATIDACGKNHKPVGMLHIYLPSDKKEGELKLFKRPRTKAMMVRPLDRNLHEMMVHHIAGMERPAGC